MQKNKKLAALKAAFPYTIPIFTGFIFLGTAYGIYMRASEFPAIYPILMSMTIFGGSMEFIAVSLLLGPFDPLGVFLLTLMVHARHIFYGISLLDKYQGAGLKKAYMIFGMCDESFSINCAADVPEGIDKGWFYFFVTLLNQLYWISGATLGGLFGSVVSVDIAGLDFVLTALLTVLFLNNWMKEDDHTSSVIGVIATIICRIIFGRDSFLVPSMLCILGALTLTRSRLEKEGNEV